jgi:type II protein arginine methyltransferase
VDRRSTDLLPADEPPGAGGQGVAGVAPPQAGGGSPSTGRPIDDARLALASILTQVHELERHVGAAKSLIEGVMSGTTGVDEFITGTAVQTIPRWHFPMLNDVERNDAFAKALEQSVEPGSHVLDIGSGTGLLAMMAVRAGAARVTTCEANPILAEVTREIVARHGMADIISVIGKRSTDLQVGVDLGPADLVVSEIVDCGLIGEGLLPTVRHARSHLLRPGGKLLPASCRLLGALLDSPVVASLNSVTTSAGLDLRRFNVVATRRHFPLRLSTWPHRLASEPVELVSFDLHRDPLEDGRALVEMPVTADTQVHGLVAWFEMDLCPGVMLHNAPDGAGAHWMQAYVPFPSPVAVRAGQPVGLAFGWQRQQLTAEIVTHHAKHIKMEGSR